MLSKDDLKKIEQYDAQEKENTPTVAAIAIGTSGAVPMAIIGGLAWSATNHPLFLITGMSAVTGAVLGYGAYKDRKEEIAKEKEIFSKLTPEQVNDRKIAFIDLENNNITPNAQKIIDERKVEEYDNDLVKKAKNTALMAGGVVGVIGGIVTAVGALPIMPGNMAFIAAGVTAVVAGFAATIGYNMAKTSVEKEIKENESLSPDALQQKKLLTVDEMRAQAVDNMKAMVGNKSTKSNEKSGDFVDAYFSPHPTLAQRMKHFPI